MGSSVRITELNKEYGWSLTLKGMCNSIEELDRISEMNFGQILVWLELDKAQKEIEHIVSEQYKNKLNSK